MNTLIYNITENFNFNNLKLENPSLINANNYFSKIYNNNSNKNFYIQLPKCKSKHGIINSNNKCFCELEFNSNEKIVAEFFENLENFCIKEICNNKALWFYDSDNITNDDIQEYITPIMRSYKGGKKFLIKTNIKQDKIIVYDENEKKISLTDYDVNNEFIPLLNINGIKFSKSTFIIDIVLVQFMVLYPSDSFENQILIKLNKQVKEDNKTKEPEKTEKAKEAEKAKEPEKIEKAKEAEKIEEAEEAEEAEKIEESNLEKYILKTNNQDYLEPSEKLIANDSKENFNSNVENETEQFNNSTNENNSFKYLINSLETIECNNDGSIELNNLDTIAENTEPIELKTHETIYLEIYKKAKQKAKEIRKNAIEAFLEAKNIKMKYNLDTILDDSSSDEENELLNLN
jgi:hypothetical protein